MQFCHRDCGLVRRCVVLVKENFFPRQMRLFLLQIGVESIHHRALHNMGRWSFYPFQRNQCEWHHTHPKNYHHDLVGWQAHLGLLRIRFAWRSPLFRLFLGLWCFVMNPCFVHGYKTSQILVRKILYNTH